MKTFLCITIVILTMSCSSVKPFNKGKQKTTERIMDAKRERNDRIAFMFFAIPWLLIFVLYGESQKR